MFENSQKAQEIMDFSKEWHDAVRFVLSGKHRSLDNARKLLERGEELLMGKTASVGYDYME